MKIWRGCGQIAVSQWLRNGCAWSSVLEQWTLQPRAATLSSKIYRAGPLAFLYLASHTPCFSSEDENHTEPPTWLYEIAFPLGVCHSLLSSLSPRCLSSHIKGAASLLQQTLSLCTMGLTLLTGEAVQSRLAHQTIRSIGLCRGIQHFDCDWCMEMEERSCFHAVVTEKGEWGDGTPEAILFPCSKKRPDDRTWYTPPLVSACLVSCLQQTSRSRKLLTLFEIGKWLTHWKMSNEHSTYISNGPSVSTPLSGVVPGPGWQRGPKGTRGTKESTFSFRLSKVKRTLM